MTLFARRGRVSVKTLRYYDEVGLVVSRLMRPAWLIVIEAIAVVRDAE